MYRLRNLLPHGVRIAFPPIEGKQLHGIPTSHAAPALSHLFDGYAPIVWPDRDGKVPGKSLAPLYPKAVELPGRHPVLYDALTLVHALRVGFAWEKNAAMKLLESMLDG